MSAEKTSPDDQIKLLEQQLAEMRKMQERTESQLAELAREQATAEEEEDSTPEEAEEADDVLAMPEIRVKERSSAADPPKVDAGEKGVLGALRRTIETVSGGQRERDQVVAEDDNVMPPVRAVAAEPSEGVADTLALLEQKLDDIAANISTPTESAEGVTQAALEQVLHEMVTAVQRHSAATEQQAQEIRSELRTIGAQTNMVARQVGELAAREEEEPAPEPEAAPGDLEAAIFGESLAANALLGTARQELLTGLMSGEQGAMGLVGQMLLFHAASADRMPHLLRDIGEAYYRWRPQAAHGDDTFQQAMIAWLAQICEQNGSANRIELVRPGDRYDAARHHAKSRGLEIAEVYGWVVLRDNGKVYTKAAVAVK